MEYGKKSAIDWKKVQAEELKHKGYTESDIEILQNTEYMEKEMLELLLKNYVHQTAMYRKKYSDAVHEGFKEEIKSFLANQWEFGRIDNSTYEWMLLDLEDNKKTQQDKGEWIRVTKEQGLEAVRNGKTILIIYEDHSTRIIFGGAVADIYDKKDMIRGIIKVDSIYVWKELDLFKFDLKAQMRKDMPELLMEEEGLTEKEAIEETEKMIESSERISTWAKDELERMKCDFSNKVTFNIDDFDRKINNPPFITRTMNAIWTPKQGPILSMNIIETIEEKYGPIPGETTKDKVEWLRKNITIVENK